MFLFILNTEIKILPLNQTIACLKRKTKACGLIDDNTIITNRKITDISLNLLLRVRYRNRYSPRRSNRRGIYFMHLFFASCENKHHGTKYAQQNLLDHTPIFLFD